MSVITTRRSGPNSLEVFQKAEITPKKLWMWMKSSYDDVSTHTVQRLIFVQFNQNDFTF